MVKWNWWWNFDCVSTKSLNFEIYFLSFPWEIIFRCYLRQLFVYLASRKCKNNCKILKITLVQIFVHQKPGIARSSIGFRLKRFYAMSIPAVPLCYLWKSQSTWLYFQTRTGPEFVKQVKDTFSILNIWHGNNEIVRM